jgi:Predicted pyridoxal phosphate-dependent enzyme apparently involved in regulation of cell wall biogenesis
MQFVDLRRQFEKIEADVRARIDAVLSHSRFIMGPEVGELERQLGEYAGVKHAFACSSGTDALVIALMALGVNRRDAVFVPSFTFFATAEAVSLAGAAPVFVDSDPDTMNLSPDALVHAIRKTQAEGILKPRGVIPVDLFGLPADYARIEDIAHEHGLFILEDAAQSFGARYFGKRACSLGDIAATSFFPAKPLGCYGDGGAVFTDDDVLALRMASLREHGRGADRYDNTRIGLNGRLDTLQAAVLLAKLSVLDSELKARRRVAQTYTQALGNVLKTPSEPEGYASCWAQYTLRARDSRQRDAILSALRRQDIPVMIYYPLPVHLSGAYSHLRYAKGSLPVCEALSGTALSIPVHPYLTPEEIDLVCSAALEAARG